MTLTKFYSSYSLKIKKNHLMCQTYDSPDFLFEKLNSCDCLFCCHCLSSVLPAALAACRWRWSRCVWFTLCNTPALCLRWRCSVISDCWQPQRVVKTTKNTSSDESKPRPETWTNKTGKKRSWNQRLTRTIQHLTSVLVAFVQQN